MCPRSCRISDDLHRAFSFAGNVAMLGIAAALILLLASDDL